MTDWQRLEQVIKWTGLSTNAFAVGIGLKRSENLYQIKRGNNGISKDLTELIAKKYPGVNRAWLLTGEGEMFVQATGGGGSIQNAGMNEKDAQIGRGEKTGIPYYNMDAVRLVSQDAETAGEGGGKENRSIGNGKEPLYYISVPGFGDCDFAAMHTGSGMGPDIPKGAIVALKEVSREAPVLLGEAYVVLTRDFGVLRYVKHQQGGQLILVTAEPGEVMTIGRDRIEKMFLVKGIIIQKVL